MKAPTPSPAPSPKQAPLDFRTLGLWRGAAVRPSLTLADPAQNARALADILRRAADAGADIAVTPELSLTGYSCGDLFHQETLLQATLQALPDLLESTADLPLVFVVGLPLRVGDRLFNTAAIASGGRLLGLVPKIHLAQRGEFYESRWFVSGRLLDRGSISIHGQEIPLGTDLLFATGSDALSLCFGVEICEDLWATEPPSGRLALGGARLLLNLSASPETLGKADYRRDLVRQQSARSLAGYLYASSGAGESTSDLLYGGHCLAAENGSILAESPRFEEEEGLLLVDFDLEFLAHERLRHTSFGETSTAQDFRVITLPIPAAPSSPRSLLAPPHRQPFVPSSSMDRAAHCREIFSIQATALARRLRHAGQARPVLGLSGGLDSTLAFLVSLQALRHLQRPAAELLALTMPGPGTTERTLGNARQLATLGGATLREISITEAVALHLRQLDHAEGVFDIAYENAHARERTHLLMDLANQERGLVVGTGDLSEAALGWCTFNGDHMSMFQVNCGVPKTLVRYLVEWCAEEVFTGALSEILRDVAATPISPELLPLDAQGQSQQETESVIGPYQVHDFFLFHLLRRGSRPEKTLRLAGEAFAGNYTPDQLQGWWKEFARRFFGSQFKRNTQPDGPKVGSVALSPRGDWRMPSDASPGAWL